MVVNKKGGKKGKKGKKIQNNEEDRKLVFKDEEQFQEYAQITKVLGSGRFEVQCFDSKTRLATIRGNMRKKVWVKSGDLILVSLREYEDAKCDIIYLYKPKEVKKLKSLHEIPENVKVNEDLVDKEETVDIGFDFVDEDDELTEEDLKNLKNKEEFKKEFESNFEAI
jgi:translation initiation factor 1A